MDYGSYNLKKRRSDIRSKVPKVEHQITFNIFRFIVIGIVIVAAMGIAAVIGGFRAVMASAPDISISDVMPTKTKSFMYYPDGTKAVELIGAQSNRIIVSIDEIDKDLQHAVVAIEDSRFYEHNGIDPKGIARAFVVGVTSGDFSEGGSTLTQQLIKMTIFGGGEESSTVDRFKRKFQEWQLALELEKQLSKDDIMEAYLNTVNFGNGAYGVEAAAERYFDKTAADLTISESAVLAAIAKSPTYYNPVDGPKQNAERRIYVLDAMLDQGWINEAEYAEAINDDVYARVLDVNKSFEAKSVIYTWFEEAALDQVYEDLMEELGYSYSDATSLIYSGGIQIFLTENKALQDIVDRKYADNSNFYGNDYYLNWALTYLDSHGDEVNIDQYSLQSYYGGSSQCDLLYDSVGEARAAVDQFMIENHISETDVVLENFNPVVQVQSSYVLMDQYTGQVLAISGGRGEKTSNRTFNRAVDALRQPGSVFKILAVYLPALDDCGLSLASTKVDAPYKTENGYEPKNWNEYSYNGVTTMRRAITFSMNIVTVKFMIDDVTPARAVRYLKNLGFTTISEENDPYPPLALGGIYNGVSNLELTAAFASIANGGTYIEPTFYTKILDRDGNVLLEKTPETRRVMKATTAWLLTSAMEDVVSSGTGTPARISNWSIAQAGKTGTTENSHDLWFVGYTPYCTAGIWFGYDNSISMKGKTSSESEHKYLWASIMNEILEGKEGADFEMPEGIQRATVCKSTGLLPNKYCKTVTEYFETASIPTEYCTEKPKFSAKICSHCGLLATDLTPDSYIFTEYYSEEKDIPTEKCKDVDPAKKKAKEDEEKKKKEEEKKKDDSTKNDNGGGN